MIVVLDKTLEEFPLNERAVEWATNGTLKSLSNVAKKKGFAKGVHVSLKDAALGDVNEYHTLGFVGMLSQSYSNHLPVAVAPHDFWFIANCELAAIIAQTPEQFRAVFSKLEEGKETLLIPTGDVTRIDYAVLADMLDKRFPNPEVAELLVPDISTIDTKVFNALCATMADAVQHYYSYMTFCCGIPAIKVLGVEADYRKLAAASRRLLAIFSFSLQVMTYYDRIAGLFDRMADSFNSENPEVFWKAIFTQKNVGSGGQVEIDGWIRDFFTKRPLEIENYETAIASVPYKSLETGNEYLGVTGAFAAVQDDEGFWNSDFRELTFKKVPKGEEDPEVTGYSTTRTERVTYYSNGTKKVEPIAVEKTPVPQRPAFAKDTKVSLNGFMLREGTPVFVDATGAALEAAKEKK
jgi:hypothetical protein